MRFLFRIPIEISIWYSFGGRSKQFDSAHRGAPATALQFEIWVRIPKGKSLLLPHLKVGAIQ